MKNKRLVLQMYAIVTVAALVTMRVFSYGCNNNITTNCQNASTNTAGPCTLVSSATSFQQCAGAKSGYHACGSPNTNFPCVFTITASGFFCPKKGTSTVTNIVTQILVDTTSGSCP
jgi:hypothetical protein